MKIDHLGIVVKELSKGIEHWQNAFGYVQMTLPVENIQQKVKVVFLSKPNSLTIKLIEPINETSPVYNFAMRCGGIHHICFECESIDGQIPALRQQGYKLFTQPETGEAFENEKIAFLLSAFGVNIELIETNKKASIISK
jgi:methylmalonyl-CoA/ethylmalonyl-CoA epimerase